MENIPGRHSFSVLNNSRISTIGSLEFGTRHSLIPLHPPDPSSLAFSALYTTKNSPIPCTLPCQHQHVRNNHLTRTGSKQALPGVPQHLLWRHAQKRQWRSSPPLTRPSRRPRQIRVSVMPHHHDFVTSRLASIFPAGYAGEGWQFGICTCGADCSGSGSGEV